MLKVKKKTLMRCIGVARIFDWGGGQTANQTQGCHQNFSKRDFLQDNDNVKWREDQKAGPGLACNLGFDKEKGLEPKFKKISKLI